MLDGSILPIVRYKEPVAAARWLCRAFGFCVHDEACGPDGNVAHVVLRHGDDFVLIGPLHGTVFDDLMVQPIDVGNRSTQAFYVTVADVDAHCTDARTAGARVEIEPCNDDAGRFYVCRDPEGHLWSFGNASHGAKLARTRKPSVIREKHPALGSRAIDWLG
ncbi:MAG: glyoxalase [Rhodospirillales bacterium]|nr:glyoxalase [Rhodospirillales bacterium]